MLPEPTNACESILSEPMNTYEAIITYCDLFKCQFCRCRYHGAIDGRSEFHSPVSPSVDKLQTLPVVEDARVNEIAEQQRQDFELILLYTWKTGDGTF